MPICSSDTITLRLRPGTPAWLLPVPAGRWRREPDGSVVARYERGDGDVHPTGAWRVGWEDIIPLNGRAKRGVIMANCPFHPDKTASFAIYEDGHAHCFGCGWHGDVLDCWAALHKITVQEALREMAR